MMLFAHVGLTLAGTRVLHYAIRGNKAVSGIDYRLVLLGSMLPDIIDKPLGGIILKEALGNGRIYSHTLIFLVLLFGAGLFIWLKQKNTSVLVLAWGSLLHHILDGMWMYPQTFLWPLYGLSFPPGSPEDWFWLWLQNLLTKPAVFVPEIAGAVFLLYFTVSLYLKKELKLFLTTGRPGTRETC